MKKNIQIIRGGASILLAVLALAPIFALAQFTGENGGDIQGIANGLISFINGTLVQLVFALAFIMFLWGLFNNFILGATSEDKRTEGKQLMLWGIIAFFVMVSVWGLVNILTSSFDFNGSSRVAPPAIDGEVPDPSGHFDI